MSPAIVKVGAAEFRRAQVLAQAHEKARAALGTKAKGPFKYVDITRDDEGTITKIEFLAPKEVDGAS